MPLLSAEMQKSCDDKNYWNNNYVEIIELLVNELIINWEEEGRLCPE